MKELKVSLKKYFHNYDWKIVIKVISLIVLIFLIFFDQLIKYWVRKNLVLNVEYSFLQGFINLKYVKNYGSAFGLNQNKTTLLVFFAFIIFFLLLIWLVFSKSNANIISITFFMAGTIGNLIDRFLFCGGVIDFLKWDMFQPKTIFNFADIMLTIGIIIISTNLIVEGILAIKNDRKEKKVQDGYGK